MADHPDRYVCGKCGYTLYRLTSTGQRLPIPENKKPAVAVAAAAAAPAKKDAGKKKKKWAIISTAQPTRLTIEF